MGVLKPPSIERGFTMGRKPKWVSSHRQSYLVSLFVRSGGFCVFGHRPCPIPEHHFELHIDGLIADWVADDRAEAQALWQAEQRAIHNLAERGRQRGEFNVTGRDAFYAAQPLYYFVGLGISGLTFRPLAKVRVSSTFTALHVELGDTLKGVSKSKRRKAIRYGKPLPKSIQGEVDTKCNEAVRQYLKR